MKAIILCVLMGITAVVSAQTESGKITVYGKVVTQDSSRVLPNTHVINKNSYEGTITNGMGEFRIEGKTGDTLVFSNVSYQFSYHQITGKEGQNLLIKMKVRNYMLDEVNVYRITSNDPKPMAIGKPMIPRTEDIRTPEPAVPTLANPVDYLYYLFSRRAKQFDKLRELKAQDYYREKLKEGSNRQILVQLTGLSQEEMEVFMFYCKYADNYINTLNDYDYLMSLMACYEQYEREQKLMQVLDEEEKKHKTEMKNNERFIDD